MRRAAEGDGMKPGNPKFIVIIHRRYEREGFFADSTLVEAASVALFPSANSQKSSSLDPVQRKVLSVSFSYLESFPTDADRYMFEQKIAQAEAWYESLRLSESLPPAPPSIKPRRTL